MNCWNIAEDVINIVVQTSAEIYLCLVSVPSRQLAPFQLVDPGNPAVGGASSILLVAIDLKTKCDLP